MSESERVMVANAADPKQVKEGDRKVRNKRHDELQDLRSVLSLDFGRRFVWRLLKEAKVFESIWHPSALIHYNSGRQDFGHFLMAEIVEADTNGLLKLMQEQGRNENV